MTAKTREPAPGLAPVSAVRAVRANYQRAPLGASVLAPSRPAAG